jgi:hypothetical protein
MQLGIIHQLTYVQLKTTHLATLGFLLLFHLTTLSLLFGPFAGSERGYF